MRRTDTILDPIIRDLGIEGGIKLARITSQWNTLFKEPLSHHMSPSSLSGDELIINVDSHVWLQELTFFKEDITRKLTSYQIKGIRFRLGRVDLRVRKIAEKAERKDRQITALDQSFIEDAVKKIADSELKNTVRRTIAKAMTAAKAPCP